MLKLTDFKKNSIIVVSGTKHHNVQVYTVERLGGVNHPLGSHDD